MMLKLFSFYTVFFFAYFFLSARVHAQTSPVGSSLPPVTAADAAEGKRHFETGLKLFKEKVYDAALIEFEQSYRLGGRSSALRNVAQCHRELKQFANAYEDFEKLLLKHGPQLKEKTQSEVRKVLADLELVTATIWLNVNEADAEVFVEDKSVGRTPFSKPIRVDIGQHTITAKKEGFLKTEKEFEASGKQVLHVNLQLKPALLTGHVRIKEKNGAYIGAFLDGKSIGPVPWEGEIEAGSHTIELKRADLMAPEQSFEVEKGGDYELILEAKPFTTSLQVIVSPEEAEASILIDNEEVGTESWEGELPVGRHVLEVRAVDYQTYRQEIELEAEKPAVQDVSLLPEEDEYTGPYGKISMFVPFGLHSDPLSTCQRFATCKNTSPVGGGLGFRFGHAWSYFSLEGSFIFMVDYRTEENSYSMGGSNGRPYREIFRTPALSTFIGAGPRFTSPGSSVRFTIAATPGFTYRYFMPFREIKDSSDYSVSEQEGYGAFALISEMGLLFGDTFGSEVMIGLFMWMDFPGEGLQFHLEHDQKKVNNPDYVVLKDEAQIYIGPTLGFRFGH